MTSDLAGKHALANLPLPKGPLDEVKWIKKGKKGEPLEESWPEAKKKEGKHSYPQGDEDFPSRRSLSTLIEWAARKIENNEETPITLTAIKKGKRMAFTQRNQKEWKEEEFIAEQDWHFTLTVDYFPPTENQQ